MRLSLGALIAAAHLALTGCASHISTKSIETAVNAFPAIAKHFESDYTNNDREGKYTFRRGRKETGTVLGVKLHGEYDHNRAIINAPYCETEEELIKAENAVTHEITHALMEGQHSLLSMKGYEGPSSEEITEFAQKVMQRPRVQEVIKTYRAIDEFNYMCEEGMLTGRQISIIIQFLPLRDKEIVNAKKGLKEFEERADPTLPAKIALLEAECDKCFEKIKETRKAFDKANETQNEELPAENIDLYRDARGAEYITRAKAIVKPVCDASKKHLEALQAYGRKQKQLVDLLYDGIDNAILSTGDEIRREMVYSFRELRKMFDRDHFWIYDTKRKLMQVPGTIATSDYEIFAQMIKAYALCNIAGRSTMIAFSPEDGALNPKEDIAFLERFKFEGKLVFGEIIKGFDEAQKNFTQGMSVEEAREKIMSRRSNGDYKIIGEIPLMN